MNHTLYRLLCLVLCTLMLFSLLIACKDEKAPVDPGKQDPDREMTEAERVLSQFEKKDYGGKVEFMIAASSSYENRFVIEQFTSDDDLNGNAVHDELFRRDNMIEAYFNISIVYDDVLDSQMANHISGSISAGDDEYSLLLANLGGTARTMFNNGYLRNLYDFEDIDLSQPWWNKKSVDNFEMNGKIFMATGAITNRYVYAPYAMLFNTRLIGEWNMENPYDLVENDLWTMEMFALMIEDTYVDDGNGTVGLEDFYGLAPASDSETAYYFACGGQMVVKQDDTLVPVYEEKINYDILQQVMDMYRTDDVLRFKETYDSNATFKDGRAIFHSTALCDITMLSNMEDKYGIVPMPKYDEDQENYISNANRSISTMAVFPITVRDTKMAGLITEALAAVSQYTSLDKQYDTVLLLRQALDEKSKRNLQLVVESVSYDWGYVFDVGQLKTLIAKNILSRSDGISDDYESIRDVVRDDLDALIAKFYEQTQKGD